MREYYNDDTDLNYDIVYDNESKKKFDIDEIVAIHEEILKIINSPPSSTSLSIEKQTPSPTPYTSTTTWFPTYGTTSDSSSSPPTGATSSSPTSAPSFVATTSESSISSILLNPQSTSGLRSCPEYLRNMDILSSTQSKDVIFTFSTEEVVTPKESYMRILETELLDYVAERVLSCKGRITKSLRLSKSTNKDVITISYSNHNKPFTKVGDCLVTTSSLSHRSKHLCFIMKGTITITTDLKVSSDVENTALSAIEVFLNEDFNQNKFMSTKYLGPDTSRQSPNDVDDGVLNLNRSQNIAGQAFMALLTISLIGIFLLFIHRYYIRKKMGYRRTNIALIEDASDASVSE